MIHFEDKSKCCGCAACAQHCPKKCISMKSDIDGFLYPVVNVDECANCGLCDSVCPILNENTSREPYKVFAAINKDENVRMMSSSGGVFSLLADHILQEGGVVFGARFDKDWQVVMDYTETIDGLAAFRGSKYVQASTGQTYLQAENFLKQGRKVLYTGTPCQIAGLKHYLRKEYDNLYVVDVACHGVPSPKVWKLYLDQERKDVAHKVVDGNKTRSALQSHLPEITDIRFRDKTNGWRKFRFYLELTLPSNVTPKYVLSSSFSENIYMRAFLANLILRPSCYNCSFKGGKSGADVTIADFWGIDMINAQINDDKGVSAVLKYTNRIANVFDGNGIALYDNSFENVLRYNSALSQSVKKHPKYEFFFLKLDSSDNVKRLIGRCIKPTFVLLLKRTIKKLLRVL